MSRASSNPLVRAKFSALNALQRPKLVEIAKIKTPQWSLMIAPPPIRLREPLATADVFSEYQSIGGCIQVIPTSCLRSCDLTLTVLE